MEVSRGDDVAGLSVELVNIILRGREVNELRIIGSVNEWLREDLLGKTAVVAGKVGGEKTIELGTTNDGRVYVVVSADDNDQLEPNPPDLSRREAYG